MSGVTTGAWCRACGASSPGQTGSCAQCGTSLAGPELADLDGRSRVGHVVQVGRVMFKKAAVVVAEDPANVSLVSKGEEISPMPLAEFDQLSPLVLPGPPVYSAAGRLWSVATAVSRNELKAGFALPLLDRIAWEIGRRSLPALRASVLDRLSLGLECEVGYLPVSVSELAWYRAFIAARAGDTEVMLRHLADLPSRGYETRADLVARRLTDLLAGDELAAMAMKALGSLPDDDPLATAIVAALSPDAVTVGPDLVGGVADVVGRATGSSGKDLADVGVAILRGGRIPARPSSKLRYVEAFDAYLAGVAGASLDAHLDVLASMPLECVDDLVDAGAVTALPAGLEMWAVPTTSYVRARLAPEDLPEEVLRAAGFDAELARRAYLRSDRAAMAPLDASDPAVVHYGALLALRDDLGGAKVPPGLRPTTAAAVLAARNVAAEARDAPTVVPERVLADPTLWPLLESAARGGNLRVSEPDHPTAHEFVCWTELCMLQHLLFEGRWSEVVVGGRTLADRTRHEALADEALNMAAFAALQLGRIDDAKKLMDEALEGHFTTGHLVNAAVVLGNRSSVEATPYLQRVFATDPREHIRAAAVQQAVELWREDVGVQDYPPVLAQLVRGALDVPVGDQLFLELLTLSAYRDEDWLASANLTVKASQRAMADYFRELARLHSSRTDVTFADFCGTLAAALRRPDRPAWVRAENERVLALLDKGLHTTFGEAVGFALGAQRLVREGVLEPVDQIYLGPQAAAHISSVIEDDDGELKVGVEGELVHASVALFHRLRSTFTPAQQAYLSEDVGRCTWAVALHVWLFTERRHSELADEYNGLNERARWDAANRPRIYAIQAALLRDFQADYLDRCRAISAALDGLTLSEPGREGLPKFRENLREWQDEVDRLRRNL